MTVPQVAAQQEMERLEKHLRVLNNLKNAITPEYPRETSLAELKAKIIEAVDAVNLLEMSWDNTEWEDLPDAETVGYEGKPQQARDLRDEIQKQLQARVNELEKTEAQSELAGAKALQNAPAPRGNPRHRSKLNWIRRAKSIVS